MNIDERVSEVRQEIISEQVQRACVSAVLETQAIVSIRFDEFLQTQKYILSILTSLIYTFKAEDNEQTKKIGKAISNLMDSQRDSIGSAQQSYEFFLKEIVEIIKAETEIEVEITEKK